MPSQSILIADDDRVFTELLSTRLQSKGYRVMVAFDATQAITMALESPPDAILLDVKMPGGTGLEAIRQLKISNKTADVPVIAVSSVDNPNLPDVVKGLGAIEFLQKPVSFQTVHKTLRAVLSLKGHTAAG